MENLTIGKTALTPQVHFQTNGILLIKGISTPENVQTFFQPVFDWLLAFKETKPEKVNFILEIDYLNSTSSKVVVELLFILNSIKKNGSDVEIVWRYEEEDEDMLELGQDLQLGSKSDMLFVAIKKN